MTGESKKDNKDVGETVGDVPATGTTTTTEEKKKKKKRGLMSRIWNSLFRIQGDDFEKRLQHISKEEASVLARMKKRSTRWRRITRNLIVLSVLFEVIAVGYAIMTTRSLDLNWKMRAARVLPMFLFPLLSFLIYSTLVSFTKMRDRKDQKTLERLRSERQAKINELKEKTNYYSTQQLIQRYDPDPAAKAAAASVLASKLGEDSGLKVYLGDEQNLKPPAGKSNDIEFVQSSGLRKRKQLHTQSASTESTVLHQSDEEMHNYIGSEGGEHNQMVVEHHHNIGANANDGGWIARIAALLVGEDPTQSYALICGNCHMHNGLARKEDFPYITYYCPHCNALNKPKLEQQASGTSTPNMTAPRTTDVNNGSGSVSDRVLPSSSPVAAAVVNKEVKE